MYFFLQEHFRDYNLFTVHIMYLYKLSEERKKRRHLFDMNLSGYGIALVKRTSLEMGSEVKSKTDIVSRQ